MTSEFEPQPVDPRTAGRDFWHRFHALRRVRQAELHPDEPLEPDAVCEAQMTMDNPFEVQHRYAMNSGSELVSWLSAETVSPGNPEHATNKHLMWADVYVMPDRRRHRIATRWLPVVARLMDRHGCSVLGISTVQDSGRGFLEWLGASPKLTDVESRLRLENVDWKRLRRWAREGARRSPNTKLEIYDGGVPEALWEEFAPQFTAMFNTIPLEELDLGQQIYTPDRLRDEAERRRLSGSVLHTVLAREVDGSISGVTETLWAPYRPNTLAQEFTGVRLDARGRGLGKWIKAAMLLHVRDLYPGLGSVITDNARSNAAMRAINDTIGFEPYRESVDYQITRAGLEAKLRSL